MGYMRRMDVDELTKNGIIMGKDGIKNTWERWIDRYHGK
jgi:hypothetical protein